MGLPVLAHITSTVSLSMSQQRISIFVHKVQHTMGKRTRRQLPSLKKLCTDSLLVLVFHKLVYYYSLKIGLI